jgi:hypothetical protein
MANLELSDLHNPDHIEAILLKNGNFVQAEPSQGFQIREEWVKLWQKSEGDLLRLVKRWRRYQSVLYLGMNARVSRAK